MTRVGTDESSRTNDSNEQQQQPLDETDVHEAVSSQTESSLQRTNTNTTTTTNSTTITTNSTTTPTHYPLWHTAVSGGVAGAASRMVTAPLDLLRIRRQLTPATQYPRVTLGSQIMQIVQTEGGVTALFRGNFAAIHLWVGYSAVQFALYDHTRRVLRTRFEWQNATAMAFGAGAVAGCCATLTTYPFDVARTIFAARGKMVEAVSPVAAPVAAAPAAAPPSPSPLQHHVPFSSLLEPSYHQRTATTLAPSHLLETSANAATASSSSSSSAWPPKNMTEFAVQLYRQRGVAGFYAGAAPAMLQIIPYMGINFAIYDYLSREDKRVTLSGYAGTISGAVSKLLVYPIDTVKRRLQAQAFFCGPETTVLLLPSHPHHPDQRCYHGMWDCVRRIMVEEGILSFYQGALLSVLKSTIATGMTFAFFRFSKNILEAMHDGTLLEHSEHRMSLLALPSSSSSSSSSSSHDSKNP